jgi:hypothetical protein
VGEKVVVGLVLGEKVGLKVGLGDGFCDWACAPSKTPRARKTPSPKALA